MPRMNITRDRTGGPVQPVPLGSESRARVAHVTYPEGLGGYLADAAHANNVWATAFGLTALHQSNKLRNPPQGYTGYIHSANDTLFAVSRLDTEKGTIELVGDAGDVSGGVHRW